MWSASCLTQMQVNSMIERFGEYLFFDSKEKQEYCCQVRKTRPHHELLTTADCWIAGVRRDQSELSGNEYTQGESGAGVRYPPADLEAQSLWLTGPNSVCSGSSRRTGFPSTLYTRKGTRALVVLYAQRRRSRGKTSVLVAGAGSIRRIATWKRTRRNADCITTSDAEGPSILVRYTGLTESAHTF